MKNMLHLVTGATTAIAFVLGLFVPYNRRKRNLAKQAALEWFALASVPILSYLVGAWLIDSVRYANGGGIFY